MSASEAFLRDYAKEVFRSGLVAEVWFDSHVPALGLERPIDLCNTYEGRQRVFDVLACIQHGILL